MPETGSPAVPALSVGTGIRYGRSLRRLFRLDDATTFLNHGSFGLTPLEVLATQAALREEMERQPVQFHVDLALIKRQRCKRRADLGGKPAAQVL